MVKKPFIYIANWKMNINSLKTASTFFASLIETKELQKSAIVICPSDIHLYPLIQQVNGMHFNIGAQNCSAYSSGAYTGEISATALADIGCTYCIVGHSERRLYFHETDDLIAQKAQQLFIQNITPIICIGESEKDYTDKTTTKVLQKQLSKILEIINHAHDIQKPFYLAYEPVWAIGTGKVASVQYLQEIFDWMAKHLEENSHSSTLFRLLYGGSVDEQSAEPIRQIKHVGGFLIGSASLDFQKFKKIVLLH